MIFSSPPFIFLFLPAVILFFWLLRRVRLQGAALDFLIVASLLYYAWWHIWYVPIIATTIIVNYFLGRLIETRRTGEKPMAWLIGLGVFVNLAPLAYFKYTGFILRQVGWPEGLDPTAFHFLLPLGISFYTFQQIAYLLDTARGRSAEPGFRNYALFVLFFPQLIAGPIVRHSEVMHQFFRESRRPWLDIGLGLTIFSVGLFKKLVLADGFAGFVNPVYAMAEAGAVPGVAAAWSAAIAYVFQLYFDFSGYSDMAIGLARCFGIVLPINFNSPYKAVSLSEFWRRWHITLVRFVRSYFFQPIALSTGRFVSRRRWSRRTQKIVSLSFPTVVIFTAIGLWHGAGWTFIVFGLVHGGLVTLEQLTGFPGRRRLRPLVLRLLRRVWLPFVLVTTFVIFRAPDLDAAMRVFAGMAATDRLGGVPGTSWFVLAALGAAITLLAPNIYQMTARYRPVLVARDAPPLDPLPKRFRHWRPSPGYAFATAGVFIVAVVSMARGVVEFIYFDF